MPTGEVLREMQRQFNEGGEFSIPVLWVDDDGVNQDDLTLFSQAGKFSVKVARNINDALIEWATGKYAALIVDNLLDSGNTGDQVVDAIMNTGIIPITIAVVSTYLHDNELIYYAHVSKEQVFTKSMPYDAIGRQFRELTEESLIADGMFPTQFNALDSITPTRPSSL